ncbi:MAG: hypothetical protein ACQCN4_10945 [Candidatus Bathyarchaeia archaeon]|jgi:chromosome segregation ATPase
MKAISAAQKTLNENDRLNILPKETSINIRGALNRKAKDAAENAAKNQYKEALKAYKSQNIAILAERMRLMGEFLELKAEYDELEEEEKWLLLSIATRNQASLLGFMQTREVSDESKQPI